MTNHSEDCACKECNYRFPEDKPSLEDKLVALLLNHAGEKGESEGAEETLKRIIADHESVSH